MRNTIKFYIISFLFIAAPLSALDGVAVIDMRTAVLSTQAAAEAFKALEEDSEYSSNLEEAKILGTSIYGKNVVGVKGNYDDVNRLCTEVIGSNKWNKQFLNIFLKLYQ